METDDKGLLRLRLKPGGDALLVRAQGFKTFVTHFEVREAKQIQTIPIALELGATARPPVSPVSSKDSFAPFTYPCHEEVGVALSEMKAMPHISATIHNSHTNADETYSGVHLSDLLRKMGAPLGSELRGEALASDLVATGSDGYQAVRALAELDPSFHPREVMVADAMDGTLHARSGPFKLVVTEDERPARSARNLTPLEINPMGGRHSLETTRRPVGSAAFAP